MIDKLTPHDNIFNIVKAAIDEFNPYGFLPRAPSDEYDSESRAIVDMLTVHSDSDEIAEVISNVFTKAFNTNFNVASCRKPAENIYQSLKCFPK